MKAHVGLQNCSYSQFTTLSLQVFMWVNVRHINISAVKNNYNGENTAAARREVATEDVLVRLCIYFLYCLWHVWYFQQDCTLLTCFLRRVIVQFTSNGNVTEN